MQLRLSSHGRGAVALISVLIASARTIIVGAEIFFEVPSDGEPSLRTNFYDELRTSSVPNDQIEVFTADAKTPLEGPVVDDGAGGTGGTSSQFDFTRRGSNVIEIRVPSDFDPNKANVTSSAPATTYRMCEITTLLPYTYRYSNSDGLEVERSRIHEDSAAVLLAIYLFNNAASDPKLASILRSIVKVAAIGDGSDASAVMSNLEQCNVKFTTSFINTHSSPIISTRKLTDVFHTPHSVTTPQPCAVLGPYSSMVTSPTAILSSVKVTPHVSYAATSTDFDNKEQYPKFARVCSNNVADARALLTYLQKLGVTHVGMIFVTDSFGSSMAKSVQDAASDYNVIVDPVSISFDSYNPGRTLEIQNAVTHLKNTRYRYFLAVIMDVHYEVLMAEAYNQTVAGNQGDDGEYVWLFTGVDVEMINTLVDKYEDGSPLAEATTGVGILQLTGPRGDSPSKSNYNNFEQFYGDSIADPTFQTYVKAKQPEDFGNSSDLIFQETPTEWGHFLFDSVIGIGLAACGVDESSNETTTTNGFITGDDLYNEFVGVEFTGASGEVRLDPGTGTRVADSVTYVMLNVVPKSMAKSENQGRRMLSNREHFVIQPSARFSAGAATEDGDIGQDSWTVVEPFIYADGTDNVPTALPPPKLSPNYIGKPSRIAGLVLALLVVVLSVSFAGWTIHKRGRHIIKVSRPWFLIMLCVGCVVMASAIVPISLEETVASQRGLDVACMAFPWLYVMGFSLTFSALFAKTWQLFKVHKDTSINHIMVTAQHFLFALMAIGTVNAVLLLVWTLTSPLKWERIPKLSKDQFDRPIESYGSCTDSNGKAVAFVVTLLTFNLLALLFANVCAYQSRTVKTEYRESHYIAITMASILQAWCLGIPIMIVVLETPQAKFWVEAGIIFVTCMATLLLVFVPKLIAHRNELMREATERMRETQRSRERRDSNYDDNMDSVDLGAGSERKTRNSRKSSTLIREVEVINADLEAVREEEEASPEKRVLEQEEEEKGVPDGVTKKESILDEVVSKDQQQVAVVVEPKKDAENTDAKTTDEPQSPSKTTDEPQSPSEEDLKNKLAAAQEINTQLQEKNLRIENELNELKNNTASQ